MAGEVPSDEQVEKQRQSSDRVNIVKDCCSKSVNHDETYHISSDLSRQVENKKPYSGKTNIQPHAEPKQRQPEKNALENTRKMYIKYKEKVQC